MASIHDLSEEVPQVLPGDPVVGLQVVVEDVHADDQVSRVERVRLVPALGPKLASLSHHGVEVAEGEEDRLELGLFGAHLQRLLLKVVKGLVQVGLHPRGRLVGDLDGRL